MRTWAWRQDILYRHAQLLFYHEMETGNYWEHDDVNGTKNITFVILENHKYRTTTASSTTQASRGFEPDAAFINDDRGTR